MSTRKHLQQYLASVGATWDDDGMSIDCIAPSGKAWAANGLWYYSIRYKDAETGQSWLRAAIRSELPELKLGFYDINKERR